MIKLIVDGNKIGVQFRGVYFHQINEYLSNIGFRYNKKKNYRYLNSKLFLDYNIYYDLVNIDSYINMTYKELCEELIKEENKLQIKFKRKKYNSDIVNFTPLKGKEPYEDYQIRDIKRFLNVNRGGCFWEQGLGKSAFISVLLSQLFYLKEIDKCLILSPSSGVKNLKREILKFSKLFTEDDIATIGVKNKEPFHTNKKIIIMTYSRFLSISDYYYKKKNKKKSTAYRKSVIPFEEWGTNRAIFLDESHYIGNYKARRSKVIHLHKEYFEYRYILSGTQADKVEKYYSQIKFLDNNLLPMSYQDWINTVFKVGTGFSRFQIDYPIPQKVKEFMDKIVNPYCVKRLSEDCLDLPPNIIKKIYVPLNEEHKLIYKETTKLSLEKAIAREKKRLEKLGILFSGGVSKDNVRGSIMLGFSALEDPNLIKKHIDDEDQFRVLKKTLDNWKIEKDSKFKMLNDLIEEIVVEKDEQIIIWDIHPETLNKLYAKYKKFNPLIVHGQIDTKDKDQYKDDIVQKFKNDSTHKILFASQKVLKEAVNLTNCCYQIYLHRSPDTIELTQSIKRIHRNGQKRNVFTYVILLENTLEIGLDKLLEKKESIDKYLVGTKPLTKEEVEDILEGEFGL